MQFSVIPKTFLWGEDYSTAEDAVGIFQGSSDRASLNNIVINNCPNNNLFGKVCAGFQGTMGLNINYWEGDNFLLLMNVEREEIKFILG